MSDDILTRTGDSPLPLIEDSVSSAARNAREYYNSIEAGRFYFAIWGGEDIHVGIYEHPGEAICDASRRTVDTMAESCGRLTANCRVLDLGAGYGGAARHLVRRFGCSVVCLELSRTHSNRNQAVTAAAGLEKELTIAEGTFEHLPFDSGSFDVVWSQDAILHSGRRRRVLEEAARVLTDGGELIFTDPMQRSDCPEGVLQPVLERIHLESLGSFTFYREAALSAGLRRIDEIDLSDHLTLHYGRVLEELERRHDEMLELCGRTYVERMRVGLGHWVDAGREGYLSWGIMRFGKP